MKDLDRPCVDLLLLIARESVGTWVSVQAHCWSSLYAWEAAPLFNSFGEQIGTLEANTIYLYHDSPCPEEDLLHELGHVVARKFDLIGHRSNGFLGRWEKRQLRLVGSVRHQRHWSRLLERVRSSAPPYTPDLTSEVWAELFMCWHLYPERREVTFIANEMNQLQNEPFIQSIARMSRLLSF